MRSGEKAERRKLRLCLLWKHRRALSIHEHGRGGGEEGGGEEGWRDAGGPAWHQVLFGVFLSGWKTDWSLETERRAAGSERERLLSEPANRSQTDLTTCPHIYLLFAVFSVQQVRNFMEGQNSRWKDDDQREPTENQRGNSDVQIDNVVFVWRYETVYVCTAA